MQRRVVGYLLCVCFFACGLCCIMPPVSAKAFHYGAHGQVSSVEDVVVGVSGVLANDRDSYSGNSGYFSQSAYALDDPFYYLSSEYDMRENVTSKESEEFTASWYQIFKYASISGFVISGLGCIIVWIASGDANKRAEKRRALTWKSILLIVVCSLSWFLSVLFTILDKLR